MADDLEATLDIDISDALRDIDNIESALTDALTNSVASFSDAFAQVLTDISATPIEIPVDAQQITDELSAAITSTDQVLETPVDQGSITGDIDSAISASDTNIAIETDASSITDEIDQAISVSDTSVDITADTTALDDIASSSDDADAALGSLTDTTSNLSHISTDTSSNFATMGSFLAQIGPQGKIAAAGFLAIVGGASLFGRAAAQAEVTQRRFNAALGDQAQVIQQINIGGLKTSFEGLSKTIGANQENLKSATASIFTLGKNAGLTGPQLNKTTQEFVALAARATTLNPSLGETGDLAKQLATSLAKPRAQVQLLGKSYTALQISQEAAAITGKSTTDTFSIVEKSAAVASLRVKELGDKLGKDVTTGAQSAEIQMRVLKEQLRQTFEETGQKVLPSFLALLKSAQPIFITLATVLGTVTTALLPIITGTFNFVEALLSSKVAVASVALIIASLLVPSILSFAAAATVAADAALGGAISFLIGIIPNFVAALQLAIGAERGLAASGLLLEASLPVIGIALAVIGGAFALFGGGAKGASQAQKDLAQALNDGADSFDKIFEAAVQARLEEKNQADDIGRLGFNYRTLNQAVEQGTAGLKTFIEEGLNKGEFAFRTIGGGMIKTSAQFDEFVKSSGGVDNAMKQLSATGNGELLESFQKLQDEAEGAAKTELDLAINAEQLTKADVKAAEAKNKNKDGTVDYRAALESLEPKINAAKEAQERKNKADELAAQKGLTLAEITTNITEKFQGTLDATSPLNDQFQALGKNSTEVINALTNGTPTIGTYSQLIKDTGSSFEFLNSVQQAAAEQIAALTQTYQNGLLGIKQALSDFDKDTSLDKFLKTFEDNVTATSGFLDNIASLRARGATGLAQSFLEAGVVSSKAAADAKGLDDKQLADKEKHFQDLKAKEDANNATTAQWAREDIRIKLEQAAQDAAIAAEAKNIASGKETDVDASLNRILGIQEEFVPKTGKAGTDASEAYKSGLGSADTQPAGESLVDKFLIGIGLKKPQVKPKGKEVGEEAKAGAKEGSESESLGISFVQGIINGLSNNPIIAALRGAASSVANTVINTVHSLFKNPPAPSQVGIELGQSFADGIAEGLSRISKVDAAAADLANSVIASIPQTAAIGSTQAVSIQPVVSRVSGSSSSSTASSSTASAAGLKQYVFNARTVDVDAAEVVELQRRADLLSVPVR